MWHNPIIWRTPKPAVCLTFDDGPDPRVTPELLDLLARHQVRATFFLIGERVDRHPELVRRISQQGHGIGNHSYTHPRLLGKSQRTVLQEMCATDRAIHRAAAVATALFRPPHGLFGKNLVKVCRATGKKMVLWSVSTRDYQTDVTTADIRDRLLRRVGPGAIVLLHDGHANGGKTLEALAQALPVLKERGMSFIPISDGC